MVLPIQNQNFPPNLDKYWVKNKAIITNIRKVHNQNFQSKPQVEIYIKRRKKKSEKNTGPIFESVVTLETHVIRISCLIIC